MRGLWAQRRMQVSKKIDPPYRFSWFIDAWFDSKELVESRMRVQMRIENESNNSS